MFAYFDLSHEEGREPLHQLFAYADPIQWGYMQLECQEVTNGISIKERSAYYDLHRKELDRKALDWKLLLQLDSDDDARMMWGDGGRLYFWICIDDLQKRAFDKVWMILQCH